MFQWLVLHSRGENCLRVENVLSDEKFAMIQKWLAEGKNGYALLVMSKT